ncbi:Histone demethylase UTY [Dissostichus eleginoides]|uniref:Histone demethylase UTY n=1 Tax=Dissostichus eleginoides TaxID=100907 RepID=A0AAD9CJ15_DISEL|nr:Histone demethylase UTY [Dissostichus eleginoides]
MFTRVKGHPEAELTLNCGDGKKAGVVQYWHTPFGNLQTPGFHKGTALWPYELSVGQRSDEEEQEHSGGEERDEFRFRRDVGSLEEMQAGVSDAHFAGAVAASVLLTFVVGFSAGALSMTPVLRCLGNLSTRFQSQRQRTTDSEVTMATLSPMYDNHAWDSDADSAHCSTMETTITPPTKPQRSFREKRQEEQETTAYLEGYSNNDETGSNRGGAETLPPAGRPSRVLRLYQYDEDGQRFAHLPQPAPEEPGPPPRLKQRSLSLKRLNTIMAAASAESLDTREPGGGEGERLHFHMEI